MRSLLMKTLSAEFAVKRQLIYDQATHKLERDFSREFDFHRGLYITACGQSNRRSAERPRQHTA